MLQTTATNLPVAQGGLLARLTSWFDFAAASFAVSRAWSSNRPVDSATLARAGMTGEIQDKVMRLLLVRRA